MGLSASQARLLTITARKSDCEYESMRLSHQKLALSRDMNNVSEEYQNAINQTKLVYDFYGNGSQQQQLSYSLLMSPSALNDYIPMMLTDTSGRIVLNGGLARAAKAAGIPQEGLGGLPSSDQRNLFIQAMAQNGVISQKLADDLVLTKYNQMAGVGSADLVNINTAECSYEELVNMLNEVKFDFTEMLTDNGVGNLDIYDAATGNTFPDNYECSLEDILRGDIGIYGLQADNKDVDGSEFGRKSIVDMVATSSFWEQMFQPIETLLDTGDPYTQAALEYARTKVMESLEALSSDADAKDNAAASTADSRRDSEHPQGWVKDNHNNYIGYVYYHNRGGDYNCGYGLSLSNMAEAYLTYFAQYMEGISNSHYNVQDVYSSSTLVSDNLFTFTYVTGIDTSGNNLLIAGFYDAMFNQICIKGWTENEKVDDPEYMQEMLQNGAMYISTMTDDGFYYQGNYSTNTYIKEVTDEEGIAQAEAKYNREKEKLSYKEDQLDLKMKNLDTEISALTTEYDTVKSVIQKNIEKSFKRYNA